MAPDTGSETSVAVPKVRVKPTIAIGLAVYAGYLAIFYATWAINDVDYETIGDTLESTKLHYAYPTLFGCAFLVVAITALGWWRITLFDKEKSGPSWAWIAPVLMIALSIVSLATIDTDSSEWSGTLVFWSIMGGLGVGFGEEMITRGALLVGLRTRFTEGKVWLYSTLAFTALHIPNLLFGLRPAGMAFQIVNTFILGSFLYSMRRISGTLLLPIFLHGLWDSSVFLPGATGAEGSLVGFPLMILGIVVSIVVVRRNWDLRITSGTSELTR